MYNVEIDEGSGFCFGVTTAIRKAEEGLAKGEPLYCLGDIVHNGQECERLKKMGLITIDHEMFARLKNVKVLLRAHGEPPQTYELAQKNNIEIIDATCPVVLRLQKRIKQEYDTTPTDREKQIVIYGKKGHAEVLGLVGQTNGRAVVRGSREAGLLERYPAVFANHQVARRVPQVSGVHRKPHFGRCFLSILRHDMQASGKPYA